MRIIRTILVVFLSTCLMTASPAIAQQGHVADQATLDRAVGTHADEAEADRQAIRRVLERDEVRLIAARAGVDIKRAETAVALLDGVELHQMAQQARAVDSSLAGGQSTVTISTTTIIIGLLLLILIIVAVN